MTYGLPDKTVVYGPGEFFFESGDIYHTVFNKTNDPMVHVLFEILPADLNSPSLIPVQHHSLRDCGSVSTVQWPPDGGSFFNRNDPTMYAMAI